MKLIFLLLCYIFFILTPNCSTSGKSSKTFPKKTDTQTSQQQNEANLNNKNNISVKLYPIYDNNFNVNRNCNENKKFDEIPHIQNFNLDAKDDEWQNNNIYIQDLLNEKIPKNSIDINKVYIGKTSNYIIGLISISNDSDIDIYSNNLLIEFGSLNVDNAESQIIKLRTYKITPTGFEEYIKDTGWVKLDNSKAQFVLKNNLIEWQIFNRELHEVLLNDVFWIKISVINTESLQLNDQTSIKFFKYKSHTSSQIQLNKCIITDSDAHQIYIDEIYISQDINTSLTNDNINTIFSIARYTLYKLLEYWPQKLVQNYNFSVIISTNKLQYLDINNTNAFLISFLNQKNYLPLNLTIPDPTKNLIFTNHIENTFYASFSYYFKFFIQNFYLDNAYYFIDTVSEILVNHFLKENGLKSLLLMHNTTQIQNFLSKLDELDPISLKTRFVTIDQNNFANEDEYEQYLQLTYSKLKSLSLYLSFIFKKEHILELMQNFSKKYSITDQEIKDALVDIVKKHLLKIDANCIWNGWLAEDSYYCQSYTPSELLKDTDLDGIVNFLEIINESSINDADTDDDSASDLAEYIWGYDPLNRSSYPNFIVADNTFKKLSTILPSYIKFTDKELPTECPLSSKITAYIALVNKNKIFISVQPKELANINSKIIWEAEIFIPALSKKIILKAYNGNNVFDVINLSANTYLGSIQQHLIPYGIYGVDWYLNLDYLLKDLELPTTLNLQTEPNIQINIQSFYQNSNKMIFCNNTDYFSPLKIN